MFHAQSADGSDDWGQQIHRAALQFYLMTKDGTALLGELQSLRPRCVHRGNLQDIDYRGSRISDGAPSRLRPFTTCIL
eukprot:1890044-Pyramimonas_sp.AAC.1